MDDGKKYFYAKFKMDSKLNVMENFIITESRSTVDEWKGIRLKQNYYAENKKVTKQPTIFQQVGIDFEDSINTFQRAVPFIMRSLPIMYRYRDDRNIRDYIAKRGEVLEKGEFELYRVGFEHLGAIASKLGSSRAIGAGINRIPSLFLMGLVSTYDSFLSQLIRCVFVARPEILSSSERNISFKDLIEIGSVDEARERIIEKEVKSVLRDSHAQQIEWLEKRLNMTLRKDLGIWPDFIEICERRNLLSHTDGKVSSQYLSVCREHGADCNNVSVGIQVIWRKLCPEQINEAAPFISGFWNAFPTGPFEPNFCGKPHSSKSSAVVPYAPFPPEIKAFSLEKFGSAFAWLCSAWLNLDLPLAQGRSGSAP